MYDSDDNIINAFCSNCGAGTDNASLYCSECGAYMGINKELNEHKCLENIK